MADLPAATCGRTLPHGPHEHCLLVDDPDHPGRAILGAAIECGGNLPTDPTRRTREDRSTHTEADAGRHARRYFGWEDPMVPTRAEAAAEDF